MTQPNIDKSVRELMGDLLMQVAQLKAVNEAQAAYITELEAKIPVAPAQEAP